MGGLYIDFKFKRLADDRVVRFGGRHPDQWIVLIEQTAQTAINGKYTEQDALAAAIAAILSIMTPRRRLRRRNHCCHHHHPTRLSRLATPSFDRSTGPSNRVVLSDFAGAFQGPRRDAAWQCL